jgi:hypothetical protein
MASDTALTSNALADYRKAAKMIEGLFASQVKNARKLGRLYALSGLQRDDNPFLVGVYDRLSDAWIEGFEEVQTMSLAIEALRSTSLRLTLP